MRRSLLITEVSRGLTQFVNPRVPLSASLLLSPLCRAELGPPPGWEWGETARGSGEDGEERVGGGGDREGRRPGLGAPCRDAGEQGGGVQGSQGAQTGHDWQRNSPSVCGQTQICDPSSGKAEKVQMEPST